MLIIESSNSGSCFAELFLISNKSELHATYFDKKYFYFELLKFMAVGSGLWKICVCYTAFLYAWTLVFLVPS